MELSINTVISAHLGSLLGHWQIGEPKAVDRPIAVIADLLKQLPPEDGLQSFFEGIDRRDPRALGALAWLSRALESEYLTLRRQIAESEEGQRWAAVQADGQRAALIAQALQQHAAFGVVQMILGRASRRVQDAQGAVAAYRAVIEAPEQPDKVLSAAHDNLGLTLTEIGELDEAVAHFKSALHYAREPPERAAILGNRTIALQQLGELQQAKEQLEKRLAELEKKSDTGGELASALTDTAMGIAALGPLAGSLSMLERARAMYANDDFIGRAINALNRSNIHLRMDSTAQAAEAFKEALNWAIVHARESIDIQHYRAGFAIAQAAALPDTSDASLALLRGLRRKEARDWQSAVALWTDATEMARGAGDHALALRLMANVASALFDHGDRVQSLKLVLAVRREAAKRGIARAEIMALGTQGSHAALGADAAYDPLGPLGLYARSMELLLVHKAIVEEATLNAAEKSYEIYDPGTAENELGILASRHRAYPLAADYFRAAIAKARAGGDGFSLVNRRAGLCDALTRQGELADAAKVAAELETLTGRQGLSRRALIQCHGTLAYYYYRDDTCPTKAVSHYQKAAGLLEDWRLDWPLGADRTKVFANFAHIFRGLARQLRKAGLVAESYEALLAEKGRDLIDAQAAQRGAGKDAAPTLAEIQGWLRQLGDNPPTVIVEFVLERDEGIIAYVIGAEPPLALSVPYDPRPFQDIEYGDIRARERSLIRLCLTDRALRELAERITDVVPAGCRLMLISDRLMQNLPLHVIPVRGKPWCAHAEITYLPAVGMLRFVSDRRSPLRQIFVAGDSRRDLEHAAAECATIAAAFGATPALGPKCTRSALETALVEARSDVVHLAVHGRGDVRRGGRASLLLATDAGGTEWVPFESLRALGWKAGLVVFSGCSTAVAGQWQGQTLQSVANSAAQTGASAIIACLWPVKDQAARVFMTAFYQKLLPLREAHERDLRVAFQHAQDTLRRSADALFAQPSKRRDGRGDHAADDAKDDAADIEVTKLQMWAPFILVGDPLARELV